MALEKTLEQYKQKDLTQKLVNPNILSSNILALQICF